MKRIRCVIDKCNSYITYSHLGLCRSHYAYLIGTLGWQRPSEYMSSLTAKELIENKSKSRVKKLFPN